MSASDQTISALVDYEDPYVQPLILDALASRLPPDSYSLIKSLDEHSGEHKPLLQFRDYESIDFDKAVDSPNSMINAYVIRKALIRKHYLSTTVGNWIVKHPSSVLKSHVKPSVDFELDYAEFLDDALVEAFDLRESFMRNEGNEPQDREWWILKPGMSDRGQGIRLFSTEEELQSIFEEWEAERPDSEADEDSDSEEAEGTREKRPSEGELNQKDYIITSQLRHFIAQPYIDPPLTFDGRKFHIRTYVLAVGALKVFVYKPMLALFAAAPYSPPWADDEPDLRAHLTNTCIQGSDAREGSVRAFWDLPDVPSLPGWKDNVFSQICSVTGAVFEAAARGMMIHFQPLPSAFELFGVDFMVDEKGDAFLLEINAFPDFRQTGDELQGLVKGLMEEVVDVAFKPFFGIEDGAKPDGSDKSVKCLDIDLGRR
ncbi:tubulin-tyrosine ligase family-domain-containing protein [Phyllosticta capitalensis]|uniref:Tubulin-tyrosine ligase family-domain-containing protein n=1 Tax=Phyllosticta capitalensis TaxID=121624 RepID=A0ABR1YSP7_9PEZI